MVTRVPGCDAASSAAATARSRVTSALALTSVFPPDSNTDLLLGVFGGAIARKRFIEMRNNMLRIQTRFRAFKARTNYVDQAAGFGRLQATIKMKKLTKIISVRRH